MFNAQSELEMKGVLCYAPKSRTSVGLNTDEAKCYIMKLLKREYASENRTDLN